MFNFATLCKTWEYFQICLKSYIISATKIKTLRAFFLPYPSADMT